MNISFTLFSCVWQCCLQCIIEIDWMSEEERWACLSSYKCQCKHQDWEALDRQLRLAQSWPGINSLLEPGPSNCRFRALSVELAPGKATLYWLCEDGKAGDYRHIWGSSLCTSPALILETPGVHLGVYHRFPFPWLNSVCASVPSQGTGWFFFNFLSLNNSCFSISNVLSISDPEQEASCVLRIIHGREAIGDFFP